MRYSVIGACLVLLLPWSGTSMMLRLNISQTNEDCPADIDCEWTTRWSCPSRSSGTMGTSFDDGSLKFRCCCGSLLQHSSRPPAKPSNCWEPCGQKGGTCNWCGIGNACCRRGWSGNPTECQGPAQYFAVSDVHECVAPPHTDGRHASVFVAVFSRRSDGERRSNIRTLWTNKVNQSSNVTVKFAICHNDEQGNKHDSNSLALHEEQDAKGDLLFLACDEGYFKGALTRKVLAAMTVYLSDYSQHDFFMKVDDDTFLSWSRFEPFLAKRGHSTAFVGVPVNQGKPCRNPEQRWYEPYETFAGETFPKAMGGGSGYVLGKALVTPIVMEGIAEKNILWNEDRAVGVWVEALEQKGISTEHVAIRGVPGFWEWNWKAPTENWATWSEYPNLAQHGLDGKTIACLAEADALNDANFNMSSCFQHEIGKSYTPLTCYLENHPRI